MSESNLAVRELGVNDIQLVCDYWMNASDEYLLAMGVELRNMPTERELTSMLETELARPISERKTYALIWTENNIPIGHSNVNKIEFEKEAFMHLHLWGNSSRRKGMGTELVRKSLPFYFNRLNLEVLYCEPFAENPAPSRTLEKVGFKFEKKYRTVPGVLNNEQDVNLWEMTRDKYLSLEIT